MVVLMNVCIFRLFKGKKVWRLVIILYGIVKIHIKETIGKSLTVCSAGLLNISNYCMVYSIYFLITHCRSAGIHDYALVQVDDVLISMGRYILSDSDEKINIY